MANCSKCIYNPNDCSDWCHVCLMSGGIFFENAPEKYVHATDRRREYMREYYKANREDKLRRRREYVAAHREEVRAYNIDYQRKYQKAYREAHKATSL